MDNNQVVVPNHSRNFKVILKSAMMHVGNRAKAAVALFIARRKFYAQIVNRARAGHFTSQDQLQIEESLKALGLDFKDLWGVRVRAYKAAFNSVKKNSYVSAKMEIEIDQIGRFLQIPYDEIYKFKHELERLRLLSEIRIGNIPLLQNSNIILQKGEQAYWSEGGSLLEERVVGRRYVGGSSGVSIRIAKGVSYRIGSYRGRMETDKALLAVSSGKLILTSKRVIFSGDSKSFDVKLDKILNINYGSDGIYFNTGGRERPYAVRLTHPRQIEIVKAILEVTMKRFAA